MSGPMLGLSPMRGLSPMLGAGPMRGLGPMPNAAATFALDFEQDDYFGFSPAFAHTRATASSLVQQFDGSFVQMLANEFGREGGRRLRNLLNNTDTLATQGVTVEAADYWLSFTGTGSVTVSGVATDSLAGTGASDRVSKKVTMGSAGTATFTVTGSVTNAYLYKSRTGQTVADPEYVSRGVLSAPYHGWGVDGVAWFKTDEEAADLTSASSGYPVRAAGIVRRPAITNLSKSFSNFTDVVNNGSQAAAASVYGLPMTTITASGPATEVRRRNATGLANSTTYTVQGLVVAGTAPYAYVRALSANASAANHEVKFDLAAKTVAVKGSAITTASIAEVAPGLLAWSITFTTLASIANNLFDYGMTDSLSPGVYTATSGQTLTVSEYVQIVAGPDAMPFVPTTTTAVTADADVITLDKDEIGYSAAGGVWVIEHTPAKAISADAGEQVLLDLYTSANERTRVYNPSSNLGVEVVDDSVSQWSANDADANWTAGTQQRVAVRFVADDGSLVTDGTEHLTDASMTVPTVTSINLGGLAASKYSGTIERIAYYAEPV